MTDADLIAWCKRDLKRYGCPGEATFGGYRRVCFEGTTLEFDSQRPCRHCSGTGIDPTALHDLRTLLESRVGPLREALRPFAVAFKRARYGQGVSAHNWKTAFDSLRRETEGRG